MDEIKTNSELLFTAPHIGASWGNPRMHSEVSDLFQGHSKDDLDLLFHSHVTQ
jgi:hypothetical protein